MVSTLAQSIAPPAAGAATDSGTSDVPVTGEGDTPQPSAEPAIPDDLSSLFNAPAGVSENEIVDRLKILDPFGDWLQQLQELMLASTDIAEFQAKLELSFPDLDPTNFRDAMIQAATLTSLKGWSDAAEN
jgi:hypothetical protein